MIAEQATTVYVEFKDARIRGRVRKRRQKVSSYKKEALKLIIHTNDHQSPSDGWGEKTFLTSLLAQKIAEAPPSLLASFWVD